MFLIPQNVISDDIEKFVRLFTNFFLIKLKIMYNNVMKTRM